MPLPLSRLAEMLLHQPPELRQYPSPAEPPRGRPPQRAENGQNSRSSAAAAATPTAGRRDEIPLRSTAAAPAHARPPSARRAADRR